MFLYTNREHLEKLVNVMGKMFVYESSNPDVLGTVVLFNKVVGSSGKSPGTSGPT